MRIWIALLLVLGVPATAADWPQAEISNGTVKARFHLPDAVNGSYQGTRFDWSGIMASLEYGGHSYFGKWYDQHVVKGHDSITGPVEEFGPVGYSEAKPGGTFVRIGVGAVKKIEEKEYGRFKTYEIVDGGKRTVKKGRDSITFTHTLGGPYAYQYVKTVKLTKNGFVLEHALRNTGDRAIDTDVYNHNFFVIDDEVVGPKVSIKFGFDAKPKADFKGLATMEGRELVYPRELQKGESVFTEFTGFGTGVGDNQFEIRNGQHGVRITGDHPLSQVIFWSIRTVACPEPYIAVHVAPGKTFKWTVRYELY